MLPGNVARDLSGTKSISVFTEAVDSCAENEPRADNEPSRQPKDMNAYNWFTIEMILTVFLLYSYEYVFKHIFGELRGNAVEIFSNNIGEISNDPTQAKRNELEELYASANEELYPGCDYVARLDFMVKFTYFKVKGKLTDSIFNEMLEFFQNVFPIAKGYKLPPSYCVIKKIFKTIGLGYESIHACVNDCFLFRGDANKDVHFCPVCNTSRWKDSNKPRKKVPKKVLRYFSIIPRLIRLYKSSHIAKKITWHAAGKCTKPDKMQHPVDGRAWKEFDTKYPDFAAEPKNVRLGLAADGFNSFGNLSQSYNMWRFIELNGETKNGDPPREFSWDAIMTQLARLPMCVKGKHPRFGGVKIKRNVLVELNWTKRSIFYKLEYWSFLTLKHNLDFMYIKKNVLKSFLNTFFMNDKSKDTAKARQDLERLGTRIGLWLDKNKNEKCSKPQAAYSFTPEDRKKFCLKSYDCHIMMQPLLPYRVQQYLPSDIAKPLIELCLFFKQICSQTLMVDDMLKAKSKVIDIVCNLELIYPPAFFNIMIHLVIHLPLEAIFGGPIRPRWISEIDTYRAKFKSEFSNKDMKEEFPGSELFVFACGPSQTPISVNSCVVNGVRFVVHSRDERRITQNNNICSPGPDGEMYYDGQSIDVDAPPNIINVVDEDNDIIDEEDLVLYDLADFDDKELVNLDIDDGVNMSADVARGQGGDSGGVDRPTPYEIPTGCKGTRKPNLDGRRAGRLHTHQETQNLGLKDITDKSGPVLIRFKFGDKETLMPLDDHMAHWANYLRELVRELSLHYPSWRQMPPKRKAVVVAKIETQFELRPHMEFDRWLQIHAAISSICKSSTMARRLLSRKDIGFPKRIGLTTWSASDADAPRIFS
nr:hypothetical protein [Tanacetum cinerariifolium]